MVVVGVLLAPRCRDVVEFDKLLIAIEIEVTVKKANPKLVFELMLEDDFLQRAIDKIHASIVIQLGIGIPKLRQGIEDLRAVWLLDFCHDEVGLFLVTLGAILAEFVVGV